LGGKYRDLPLSQIAEYAISETDLITVQEFIREIYEKFDPSDAHLRLPTFTWWGLATSNFDRLIERAYEIAGNPLQTPRPFIQNGDRVEDQLRDARHLMLLKLHGCISRISSPECPLILTTDQYVDHRRGRSRIFDHLRGWSFERPIVFIGHGLQDSDLRIILLELSASLDTRPRYYAVLPGHDEIQQRYWESKKVTVLNGTFADFMRFLDARVPGAFRQLAIRTQEFPLPIVEKFKQPGATLSALCTQFLTTDVEYVRAVSATQFLRPQTFYKGLNPGWSAIEQNLDIRRHLADTILTDVCLVEESAHEERPELVLVKGHAGSGKSVLLRRIAWEAAKEYRCLCLFMQPHGRINSAALQELINVCQERIYLFVDNAAGRVGELRSLLENIGPEGKRLTVIVAERTNEWNVGCGELVPLLTSEYELKYLSRREIDALLARLEEHRSLGTLEHATLDARRAAFADRAGRQLLVALHEATLSKRFEDIVEDEYLNIRPDEAQRIYLSICVLNRLGVPVRAGIIARMHGVPFEEFKRRLFGPLEEVVHTEWDAIIRDYSYRARHRHIAEMVFQRVLRDQENRYEHYIACLRELNIDYGSDEYAFRQMVRGRTVLELFPNHELGRGIYEVAQAVVGENPHLLHQMALYEMHRPNGSLRQSGELLARASTLAPWDLSIKHSIAEHRVRSADTVETKLERDKLHKEARQIAVDLKRARSESTFAHHTLVKIGLRRLEEALREGANTEEIQQIIKDIEQTLSDGLQRLPGDSYLLDAESQLAGLLNDSDRAFQAVREAFKSNPRNAFAAGRLAKLFEDRADPANARATLEKALDANPGDRRLHFAYARLLMRAVGTPGDQLAYHLQRSFTPGDTNYHAQILYGRQLFINGDLEGSAAVFRVAGAAKVGPDLRDALLYPLNERFTGSIVRMEASYCFIMRDGTADRIFAHRDNIPDRVWAELVLGSRVSFRIGFSLRGPHACDVLVA